MAEQRPGTLVGIALVPEPVVLRAVVSFAQRWGFGFGGLQLDGERILPHVSLHQLWTRELAPVIDAFEGLTKRPFGTTRIANLVARPPDWIFATVATDQWLLDRQSDVLERFGPLLDPSFLKGAADLVAYSEEERRSYLRHGYRYVGEAFLPHFTLGRSSSSDQGIAEGSREDFAGRLAGAEVGFDRTVLFRAGPGGSIAEIIAESA